MRLRDISGGSVTGTGTVEARTGVLGAVNIAANGSDVVTVTIKETNASGRVIFATKTPIPLFVAAPFETVNTVYYDISGTGGELQLFEWKDKRF